MRLPREVAGFDSASAMVVALARFLHGRGTPPLGNSAFRALRPAAAVAARLPVTTRQWIYSVFSGAEGRREADIARIDAETVAASVAALYPRRRYPAVVIGSSNGALTHLCAALGVPWLPQTLLLPVRQQQVPPDDPMRAAHAFDRTARALLDRNPALVLHHMHDPNQDRLTLRRMAYFRVKHTRLGRAYEKFITDLLEPGGTILIAECGQQWPTTRIGRRHLFQLGAVGGMPPEEYRTGGPRVADYLRRYGAAVSGWQAPPADADSPEAEWGFEPVLRDDITAFADRHGFRTTRLMFDQPEDLSPPIADLYRWWYRQRGLPANRLLIDSFILLDPWWTLRTGSVPYWTAFPVQSSLAGLHRYLDGGDGYDYLHLALFCHGVDSVGVATAGQWRQLLRRARIEGAFAGVSPSRYPNDPYTFFGHQRALRAIPDRYPNPQPLPLNTFKAFLRDAPHRYPRVEIA
ncbi:hypothetical protein ONA91_35450 [Micromonospora sp. DR5-3]|uniref:hypothetical protein n=1 Tax=unclassified Micromonospora TaxID=2617518 RepID=UPI0011DB2C33|nr:MULTISPECIES: hypothetical protein [unclassified Micromonospora]MCW3819745.1 hypothetical protein [Micromonospora sp. DR5-3]TYC23322.1 hypothetical protein FXF52_15920 [Micromonospora sp. MP36]